MSTSIELEGKTCSNFGGPVHFFVLEMGSMTEFARPEIGDVVE
jgi:hypothetical protein